jgi:hypothetical protein
MRFKRTFAGVQTEHPTFETCLGKGKKKRKEKKGKNLFGNIKEMQ